MSRLTRARAKITSLNHVFLENALLQLASQLGGKLTKEPVKTWSGTFNVDYLVSLPLPYGNGYGIRIDNNNIEIIVDEHAPLTAQQFKSALLIKYLSLIVASAGQALGFRITSITPTNQGKLTLELEK